MKKKTKVVVKNMKVTMINKLNVIISLWLLTIIGTLMIFGYELGLNGFYWASLVIGGILLIMNTCHLFLGISRRSRSVTKAKAEYKKY